jgi:DGQHR domain-containing protein
MDERLGRHYFKSPLRGKPKPFFYMFNIDARLLKKLSDVHRRKPDGSRTKDIHVQRNKNDDRVREIRNYIEGGFPWSTISRPDQKLPENAGLKMPGLLPTAIIANIIGKGQERNGKKINDQDVITVNNEGSLMPQLTIPDHIFDDDNWDPSLKPIEIIDGQHRLWAFNENQTLSGNFEFPVIAFYDLDRAWQAYLFYTINIKPVKINTSLGFDLYPLLRTQSWLENSKDGLLAYRETRAQEIVESLWLYEESPWFQRINMIGEAGGPTMSQAAFVRSLVNSFFKRTAGLYSDKLNENFKIINWNRAQQAGFVILLWQKIEAGIKNSNAVWAESIRNAEKQTALFDNDSKVDSAFMGKTSFLSRDQGVRGVMTFANDFFYAAAKYGDIDFNSFIWEGDLDEQTIANENITEAIALFKANKSFVKLINEVSKVVANVDWRTSSAVFATDQEREYQMRYKGSSGYTEFYREIIKFSKNSTDANLVKYANQLA